MAGVLKFVRKSAICLFLLVITSSFTLKNVDKRDGYILSDVSELFVAKSLSMETTQLSTSFRSKRPVMTKEGNHLQSLQILRLTRDVLFVKLVLLCGDVLQNPGPVRIQCFNCHKTIRKNQGRADCSDCLQSYHLKCLGVDFETSKKCSLCSVKGMDSGGESGVECTDFNIATELHEAIKLRGLKFIHQNIRSIRGKLDELNILISQCPNLHILAFTETWLDNGIADGEISLPGYKIFRSDRPNGKGGGIAVYVKGSLSIIRRVDLEQQFPGECILLEILLPKAKGILFGTFYRPPSQTDFMNPFRDVLESASAENKELIVTGDFNCDFLVKSCSKETRELKEIFRNFGLTQLIDKATRTAKESSTLLDLFASNSPGNITFTNVVASSLSDHDMLIAVRKINACKLPPRTIECRNYAKYNPSAFCDDLRDIPWDDVLKERNVNTAWSNWKELFLNVCDRHAPYKRKIVRGVKCPWLTGETKKLMNQRDFFLRKARRSGAEVDWNAYRRLRNQVSNKIRNEKRRYHRNEIQENLNSPKAFWKAIKKVFPSKKGNSACPESIKTEEGHTVTDKSTNAEKFNNFFTNAVSTLLETVQQPVGTREFGGDNFTDQKLCLLPVTETVLYLTIERLKGEESYGLG